MTSVPIAALLVAGAYFLGAVPFALLLGFLKGVDIRKVGSGNVGATNLSRALGRAWGVGAFALDFAKGLLPVLACSLSSVEGGTVRIEHIQVASGLAAILGHVFPIYLRFRGGKGVATSFGAVTGLVWVAALAAGAVWAALYFATRTVSIASLGAAVVFPLGTAWVARDEPMDVLVPRIGIAIAITLLIVVRHRSNIRRLVRGEESRF